MSQRTRECIDEGIGELFSDFSSGALDLPAREPDRYRFIAHIRICSFCRNALLEHAHQAVVIPELLSLSIQHGIEILAVAEAVKETTQQAILSCEAEKVFPAMIDTSPEQADPALLCSESEFEVDTEVKIATVPDIEPTATDTAVNLNDQPDESPEVRTVDSSGREMVVREEEAEATPYS